jgi:hypothetical protein
MPDRSSRRLRGRGARRRDGAVHIQAVVMPAQPGTGARERVAYAVRAANRRLAPHQRIAAFTLWEHGELPRTNLRKVKRHEVVEALEGRAAAGEPDPPLLPAFRRCVSPVVRRSW